MPGTRLPHQDELCAALKLTAHGSDEQRYLHRLHCVWLVVNGCGCEQVARWFGDSPRSVERWVCMYERCGLTGLTEHHGGGRPARLTAERGHLLALDIDATPAALGLSGAHWTGGLVAEHLAQHYGVRLSVRQCQRLLRRLRGGSVLPAA